MEVYASFHFLVRTFLVSTKAQILCLLGGKGGVQNLVGKNYNPNQAKPAWPRLTSDWANSAQPSLFKARHGGGPGLARLLLEDLARGPERNGFGHLLEDLAHVILSRSNILCS